MTLEKRRRTRVDVGEINALLKVENVEVPITLLNVSLKGLLCDTPHPFSVGQTCVTHISLSNEVKMEIESKITRVQGNTIAVEYENIDVDDFPYLHRLVQLHADNPDEIDQELRTKPLAV